MPLTYLTLALSTSEWSKSKLVNFAIAQIVPLNTPGPAQRSNRPPFPLDFFHLLVISINPGSFENMINLKSRKWVCACREPALGPSWLKMTKPDLPKVFFSKLSGMLGATPLSGIKIIWGSAWVFGGPMGGLLGSFWDFFKWVKKLLWRNLFLSIHTPVDAVLLAQSCPYIWYLRI